MRLLFTNDDGIAGVIQSKVLQIAIHVTAQTACDVFFIIAEEVLVDVKGNGGKHYVDWCVWCNDEEDDDNIPHGRIMEPEGY